MRGCLFIFKKHLVKTKFPASPLLPSSYSNCFPLIKIHSGQSGEQLKLSQLILKTKPPMNTSLEKKKEKTNNTKSESCVYVWTRWRVLREHQALLALLQWLQISEYIPPADWMTCSPAQRNTTELSRKHSSDARAGTVGWKGGKNI